VRLWSTQIGSRSNIGRLLDWLPSISAFWPPSRCRRRMCLCTDDAALYAIAGAAKLLNPRRGCSWTWMCIRDSQRTKLVKRWVPSAGSCIR